MTIAVLAVQGAFIEHEKVVRTLGAHTIELRNSDDVHRDFDGLILPGGESTTQGKLLRELGMFEPLRMKILQGLPVLATCAGLILLSQSLQNDEHVWFATLPVTVRRNAYGRQLGSFIAHEPFAELGDFPMHFIRAPYIETADADVHILAQTGGHTVAVQYGNQLALAFHPEVSGDNRIHRRFLAMCEKAAV